MSLKLTPEAWAQVRYKYEHTDEPVDDICLDHGISANTLRDRVRRWRWTRRHEPVPAEGPPPLQPIEPLLPLAPTLTPGGVELSAPAAGLPDGSTCLPTPPAAASEQAPADPAEIVPRLKGAVARVLPAIDATLGKLAAGPMHPREMERAVRTLTALTRTLRELNELLDQHQPSGGRTNDDDYPEDIDAFRIDLARRIDAFVASQPDDETAAAPAGE